MQDNFFIIAITRPDFFDGEAERINQILSSGQARFLHLRKPEAAAWQIEKLLRQINPVFYDRVKLHDHFELLEKYDLGGINLNSRNCEIHPLAKSVSKSIHSLSDITSQEKLDYLLISPVFNSISKVGYKAAYDINELSAYIRGKNVVALGGVTPEKFNFLQSMGFVGAALLGYFFPTYMQTD